MGGHHAGKFDFDTRISGVTSLNYEKSLIFDDLAGGYHDNQQQQEKILASIENEDKKALPKWTTRNVFDTNNNSGGDMVSVQGTIDMSGFEIGNTDGVGVMIQNDEISWEPFYVTIETTAGGHQAVSPSELGLIITPSNGNLAPRGGANNACDASRPYSDCWEINVSLVSSSGSSGGRSSLDSMNKSDLYLVVRTEMDHWIWKIIL